MSTFALNARAAGARLARAGLWGILAAGLGAGLGVLVATGSAVPVPLVAGAVAAALVARWPLVALLGMVAYLPRDRPGLQVLTTIGVAVWVLARMRPVPGARVALPWLALLAIALASVPLKASWDEPGALAYFVPIFRERLIPSPSHEMVIWLQLAFSLAMFVLAALAVTNLQRVRWLVGAALVSAVYPIIVGLQQLSSGSLVATSPEGSRGRAQFNAVRSIFEHPNPFAFYLVIILILALVVLLEARSGWARTGALALLATGGLCMFHTFTRSAWIVLALSVLAMGVVRYRKLLLVAVVLVPLTVFAYPATAERVKERFGDLTSQAEAKAGNSWTWRNTQWTRMIPYGLDHPLTGQGFGSYTRLTVTEFGFEDPRYQTVPNASRGGYGFSAHNDYVRMLVELGIPGLLLWIAVMLGLVACMVAAARAPGLAPYGLAMVCLTAGFVVMSYADNLQGYTVSLALLAALAGGLVGAMASERLRGKPASPPASS